MLSRTTLSYFPPHNGLNSSLLNHLQPLCRRQKSQLLWNQANPASFSKIPGWGGYPECFYGTPGVWGGHPDPVFGLSAGVDEDSRCRRRNYGIPGWGGYPDPAFGLSAGVDEDSRCRRRFYGTPGVWGGHPDPVPLHFSSPPCPPCSGLGALCVKPFLAFAGRQAQMVPPTTFRINTCKSVSKQMTLTPFRINTYAKTGGGGYPHGGTDRINRDDGTPILSGMCPGPTGPSLRPL